MNLHGVTVKFLQKDSFKRILCGRETVLRTVVKMERKLLKLLLNNSEFKSPVRGAAAKSQRVGGVAQGPLFALPGDGAWCASSTSQVLSWGPLPCRLIHPVLFLRGNKQTFGRM